MPTINAVQHSEVHGAIARASAATGVNFDYLLAQARLESGLDPDARARTSSAAGLYQFTSGTWLETLDRHGSSHGLGWADAGVGDPAMRSQIMALRYDPDVSALMAAELARDNAADLRGFLGREPDSTELYLAHFLGSGGAREFLGALRADPGQTAATIFPAPAAANRTIFYDAGRPRTVGEVMTLMQAKVAGAMEGGATPWQANYQPTASSAVISTASPMRPPAPEITAPTRPSMADTLRATFGNAGHMPGGAGQRVDEAYAKFRSFGL